MTDSYFKIDTKNVFFESFANENVIVNISKGNYYSMKGSAVVIWSLLEDAFSMSQLINYITVNYTISEEIVKPIISQFIEMLQSEELILTINSQEIVPIIATPTEKIVFEEPVIEIFRDLQELLLLDPIHEVDEVQGWPTSKK